MNTNDDFNKIKRVNVEISKMYKERELTHSQCISSSILLLKSMIKIFDESGLTKISRDSLIDNIAKVLKS